MTTSHAQTATTDRSRFADLRAFTFGAVVTAVATAVALASQLLPAGTSGFAVLGVGLAFASGAAVLLVHSRLLRRGAGPARGPGGVVDAGDPRLQTMRVQAALGIGFLAKLLGLAVGVGALVAAEVKFAGIAAFALAFAGASLVFQLCTALSMVRNLAGRAPVDRPLT